jgi:hypothetical protein
MSIYDKFELIVVVAIVTAVFVFDLGGNIL